MRRRHPCLFLSAFCDEGTGGLVMATLYCQGCDMVYECPPGCRLVLCWCGGQHFTNDPSLANKGKRLNEADRWLLLSVEALEGTW